jgi:rhodanese-related sulfurtransferase
MIARLMGLKTISPVQLLPLVQSKQVKTFDLNPRQSWLAARVPGACWLEPDRWDDKALPTDKSAPLAFYCSGPLCRKAPLAARRAMRNGYEHVHVMSAGIHGWLAGGLQTESGE